MFEKLLGRLGYVKKPEVKQLSRIALFGQKRAYQAAQVSNLLSDWTTNNNSADIEMRLGIRYIRNRTRDLERNDDYTRKFLRDLEGNVIGHSGFRLMMKLKTTRGDLDRRLNEAVETSYKRWRQRGNYDVTGLRD
jgi:capsid protein